jgi:hypothetical protein
MPIASNSAKRELKMETFVMGATVMGATLVGSFATAFVIQKAALEALLRVMDSNRRARR